MEEAMLQQIMPLLCNRTFTKATVPLPNWKRGIFALHDTSRALRRAVDKAIRFSVYERRLLRFCHYLEQTLGSDLYFKLLAALTNEEHSCRLVGLVPMMFMYPSNVARSFEMDKSMPLFYAPMTRMPPRIDLIVSSDDAHDAIWSSLGYGNEVIRLQPSGFVSLSALEVIRQPISLRPGSPAAIIPKTTWLFRPFNSPLGLPYMFPRSLLCITTMTDLTGWFPMESRWSFNGITMDSTCVSIPFGVDSTCSWPFRSWMPIDDSQESTGNIHKQLLFRQVQEGPEDCLARQILTEGAFLSSVGYNYAIISVAPKKN